MARSSSHGRMIARERERGERVWARTAKTRDPDTDRPTDTHYRSGRAETEIEKERERNPIPRITYTALQRISILLQLFSSHLSLSLFFLNNSFFEELKSLSFFSDLLLLLTYNYIHFLSRFSGLFGNRNRSFYYVSAIYSSDQR